MLAGTICRTCTNRIDSINENSEKKKDGTGLQNKVPMNLINLRQNMPVDAELANYPVNET
jgi:hypothetical protein